MRSHAPKRKETSLVRQVMLRVNLVSLIVLATFGAILVYVSATSIRDAMESKIQAMAFYISKESAPYLRTYDYYALEGFARQAVHDPDIDFVEFHDTRRESDQIVAQAQSEVNSGATTEPKSDHKNRPTPNSSKFSNFQPTFGLTVSQAISSDEEKLGYVVVGYNTRRISAAVNKVIWLDVFTILCEQALLIVGVVALLRKNAAHIHRAMGLLDQISRTGDYSVRMSTDEGIRSNIRELNVFVREFDRMLTEIQSRDDQIRAARDELEAKVRARTYELEQMHKQSLRDAHMVGMAEVAAEVIHNIGNVLNSMVISLQMIQKDLSRSRLPGLSRANRLLLEHGHDLDRFLVNDTRGKSLPAYFQMLSEALTEEHRRLESEAEELAKKLDLITEIIRAQQFYAMDRPETQELRLVDLIEDSLSIEMPSFKKRDVVIERHIEDVPPVRGHATKLIQVMLNLIKNAEDAMEQLETERVLRIDIMREEGHCVVRFSDNGVGLETDELKSIFRQGYTTKWHGHGFGLHYAANVMSELGGSLKVESRGKGRGATFSMYFPVSPSVARRPRTSPSDALNELT